MMETFGTVGQWLIGFGAVGSIVVLAWLTSRVAPALGIETSNGAGGSALEAMVIGATAVGFVVGIAVVDRRAVAR